MSDRVVRVRPVMIVIAGITAGVGGLFLLRTKTDLPQRYLMAPVEIRGAVLRDDPDPNKQSPLGDAKISARSGLSSETGVSAPTGLFALRLPRGPIPGQPIILDFQHSQYRPVEMRVRPEDKLYIVRMEPRLPIALAKPTHSPATEKASQIKNVRIRYSIQNEATVDVGSLAKQFQVANVGNIPCENRPPCSPDGKWKATLGTLNLDAEARNEFRNVRVTCVGGPCPFTRTETADLAVASREKKVSVLNWSDTASFVVEAEVIRPMATSAIRHSYPFIVGPTMTFALPKSAEGPSIDAEMNGQDIVYPLGPDLILSWATCSVELSPNGDKIFRCTVKPGYEFAP